LTVLGRMFAKQYLLIWWWCASDIA